MPDPSNELPEKAPNFELGAPIGGTESDSASPGIDKPTEARIPPPPPSSAGEPRKEKSASWKGFEEVADEEEGLNVFAETEQDNEVDMTPMVDVTFLLLIFFMVTASFLTQQVADQPSSQDDLPSTNFVAADDQDDYVEVIIDQSNLYRIGGRNFEEVEAPSDIEMKAVLRDAKDTIDAHRLIVTAHEEAHHQHVVTVWDFGKTLGFEQIQIQTTNREY